MFIVSNANKGFLVVVLFFFNEYINDFQDCLRSVSFAQETDNWCLIVSKEKPHVFLDVSKNTVFTDEH